MNSAGKKLRKMFLFSCGMILLLFVSAGLMFAQEAPPAHEPGQASSAGAQSGAVSAKQGKEIDSSISDKFDEGEETVNVIVLLKGYRNYVGKIKADDRAQMKKLQAEIHGKQAAVMKRLSAPKFKVKHRFENILGFSGNINKEGLRALTAMPEVAVVEEDKKVEAHLAQGIPLMNASSVQSAYDGTGVSIAVVDTGVDYTHAMLGGGGFPNAKVIGGRDLGDGDADPMDCQGHGTSVAGIAAGTLAAGPGDYIGGVAHNAKVYALKIVAGCGGSSSSSTIAAAWDWAVSHKNDDPANPILIINTSFGGGYYTAACDASNATLATSANNAVANGITLFTSSGNDGFADGISSPACVSNSISVGAVYDADIGSYNAWWVPCVDSVTQGDLVTCYSNSASFVDILGPSNNAYTTAVGGGYRTNFGGTSSASPYSAGAGAVLQNYAKSTTGAFSTPTDLKARLVATGDPVTDAKNGITKPRVNVGAAAVQIEQTPWKTNENGTLLTGYSWDYTMGYHFTPSKDGHITWLGGHFDGTKAVYLWNKGTGQILAKVLVTSTNGWGYATINPVAVKAGTTYTVAAYLAGSGGSYRYGIDTFPQTYGDIKIEGSTYAAGNTRPINNYIYAMYGQVDIGYVAAGEQTPWKTNENGTVATGINWNYTMGYHFTPKENGQITQLGGYFNGAKTVYLWNKASGALLASATVTSADNWQYRTIKPVTVTAGTTYTVAVFVDSSGGSYRHSIAAFPQSYGDITISGSTYLPGNGRPTNTVTNYMYGQVDVAFMPFSGQTPWETNENGTVGKDIGWDYTMGYHFTPRKSGVITWLGGYYNGAKTVSLWNKGTGALLATAEITSANGWTYANIDPVAVTAGTTYTVAAYMAGSGASYRSGIASLPQTYGDITITGSTYVFGNGQPVNTITTVMYGQVDVGFVPDSEQTPWETHANGTLTTDIAWNYTMGYHFTPARDGTIARLGGLFNGTKVVYLWNKDTATQLATATVTSANDWSYASIAPVAVTAGTTYTVAVSLAGSGGSYRVVTNTFPQTYEDITITGSTYLPGSGQPVNTITNYMYGQVDVGFAP